MNRRQNVKIVRSAVFVSAIVFFLSMLATGADAPKQTSTSPQTVNPGPSSFRPDMTFEQAIHILRHSTNPPLNIAVLWKDLEENTDIYRDTPIGIDGLSGVPIRRHLKSLLTGVSGGNPVKLGYVVDDGVIVIATIDSLPAKMTARVYDVRDLVAAPANYFFIPPMGMPFGGFGGYGTGGGMGTGFLGAGAGMTPGGTYGYGNGLTGLLQNQYGAGGGTYGNYPTRPIR
ncbi:MAG: hypothetical protein JXM79_14905 [Sedimentisphaerales bacterium]|nr:hypothetical protein [Sedimentisphaerales bacterium]